MSYRVFIIKVKRDEEPLLLSLNKEGYKELYDYVNLLIDLNILNKSRIRYNLRKYRCLEEKLKEKEEFESNEIDEILDNIKEINDIKEMLIYHEKQYCKYLRKLRNTFIKYNNVNIYFKKYIYGVENENIKKLLYLKLKENILFDKFEKENNNLNCNLLIR